MTEISTEYFIAKIIKPIGLRYFVLKYRSPDLKIKKKKKRRCYELTLGLYTTVSVARKYVPFVLCLPFAGNAYFWMILEHFWWGDASMKNKCQCLFILNFPQSSVKNQVVWKLAINGKESDVGILDLGILGYWTFPSCGIQITSFSFNMTWFLLFRNVVIIQLMFLRIYFSDFGRRCAQRCPRKLQLLGLKNADVSHLRYLCLTEKFLFTFWNNLAVCLTVPITFNTKLSPDIEQP
jgi:hypothetical protein